MGADARLETPWLREELMERLRDLGDIGWLSATLDADGRPEAALNAMLDFLDDTGVVDDPVGRIGYILYDEREATALRRLGAQVEAALSSSEADRWLKVAPAARDALQVLSDRGG